MLLWLQCGVLLRVVLEFIKDMNSPGAEQNYTLISLTGSYEDGQDVLVLLSLAGVRLALHQVLPISPALLWVCGRHSCGSGAGSPLHCYLIGK